MLRLPEHGVLRSVNKHNSTLAVLCDWIEASALASSEEISRADVVDYLVESQIYDDQDFCREFVASSWSELRRRQLGLGLAASLAFADARLNSNGDWRSLPAQSFCLILSLAPVYEGWSDHFGSDYTDQGEMFELLAAEALAHRFRGWIFKSTGWSASSNVELAKVVPSIAQSVFEEVGNVQKWASGKAHEAGLDLTWYLPFGDVRSGLPVYLAQCASGANWAGKVLDPQLALWTKLIDFTHPPSKALVIPFALSEEEFQHRRVQVSGLLIDRYRLLPDTTDSWLSTALSARLVTWLEPRIAWINADA